MAVAMTPDGSPAHPVQFSVPYSEGLSRGLIFVKWLLAIPHFIVLYFLNIAFMLVTLVAFFSILFTTRYPEGLFKFAVGARRWYANVSAYIFLLRDEYPPFSIDEGEYAVVFTVDRADPMNRFLPLIKWLLVIPSLIVVSVLMFVAFVVTIIAWFAILFTGRYPEGMFQFVVGTLRWNERVTAYVYLLTDAYPPFSLDP